MKKLAKKIMFPLVLALSVGGVWLYKQPASNVSLPEVKQVTAAEEIAMPSSSLPELKTRPSQSQLVSGVQTPEIDGQKLALLRSGTARPAYAAAKPVTGYPEGSMLASGSLHGFGSVKNNTK